VTDGSRRRLLVLTPDFPPAFGGIQLLVSRLVESFERFEVRVVALDEPGAESVDRAADLEVVRTRRSLIPKASNLLLNAGGVREAIRFRPDVVLAAHIIVAPAAALIQRVAGAPFVQYLHGHEIAARPRLARFAVKSAAASIAVSSYTARLATDIGADAARVHCIPPGVDLPSSRRGERDARPTVLTLARLTAPYKGHDVLIQALPHIKASVPDVAWVVVGDGPLRDELAELARDQGVADSTVFAGSLADAERDAWLDRAHVFAMPSRLPPGGKGGEGFGIVYLEAGAHSLPVVAGNVAGALDAVVDGKTGLLVDPTDPKAVADAVSDLLLDRRKAEALGRAGAARARDFTWPKTAARVEDLLIRTLHARET
jgi:phosphatidylinositol alpha-1,6-mannosyltransferase